MIAESAVIGRRMGFPESARSMMITWAVSPTFSLTQMNLSDSKVRVANPICWTLMPTFWSCGKEEKAYVNGWLPVPKEAQVWKLKWEELLAPNNYTR